MAFREHAHFKIVTLPDDRQLSAAAARRRAARASFRNTTPRSVTKPHQHHVITITRITQLDIRERAHDEREQS